VRSSSSSDCTRAGSSAHSAKVSPQNGSGAISVSGRIRLQASRPGQLQHATRYDVRTCCTKALLVQHAKPTGRLPKHYDMSQNCQHSLGKTPVENQPSTRLRENAARTCSVWTAGCVYKHPWRSSNSVAGQGGRQSCGEAFPVQRDRRAASRDRAQHCSTTRTPTISTASKENSKFIGDKIP